MKLPKMTAAESNPGGAAIPRRTAWDSVLTATPVMLTVLATVLAGLSNSEMTLAQYHRALAAQFQSKAGDQWNFFQAKRIRGTSLEMTIGLLNTASTPGEMKPSLLQISADRMVQELRRAQKEASRLQAALDNKTVTLGPAGPEFRQAAAAVLQATHDSIRKAEMSRDRIKRALALPDEQRAFTYLATAEVPPANTNVIQDPTITQALQAVRSRIPDKEIAPLVRQVPEEVLRQAIETAEANVQAVEQADKPVSDSLNRFEALVREQAESTRALVRAVRNLDGLAADLPAGDSAGLTEIRSAAAALARCSANIKTLGDETRNDFKAAQYSYTGRRYEREARYNEEAADLYEIQVRKSSTASERNRGRSKQFFYGMLAAQAGVTIASFSLAVKFKSLLWSLASLAGLGAILFALYVYLYV